MRSLLVMLLALLVTTGLAWSGQQPDPAAPSAASQAKAFETAEGELSRVDVQQHLFWIKTADGKEMQFSYANDTPVEGTGGSAEGLANMSGKRVTVQYETKDGAHNAVKISVQS